MIPKVIHYCWFGKKTLPPLAIKCIDSWKRFLPNYEIKEWNENNFDISIIPYTKDAYKEKKFAFVSDYARFWILYNYGGIYFDTDVELIKPIDGIITDGSFMGCERNYDSIKEPRAFSQLRIAVNPGLGMASKAGHPILKELLDIYHPLKFIQNNNLNLKTIVSYTTECLYNHNLRDIPGIQNIEGIKIYPTDYFSPLSSDRQNYNVTKNTVSIHHYAASWMKENHHKSIIERIWNFFNLPQTNYRKKIKKLFFK